MVDSDRAMLVWEARHLTPVFAVPAADIKAELIPTETPSRLDGSGPDGSGSDPQSAGMAGGNGSSAGSRSRFRRHPGQGEEFTVRARGAELPGAAFRPADPDLSGYLLLDFGAFDRWREEEEVIEGHPRDPFHRVDARAASHGVRVEFNGTVLAESVNPVFVYETMLPVRIYLPRADVDLSLLVRSEHQSVCPYKGRASYWSVSGEDRRGQDLAWSYEHTLPDSGQLKDLIAFYDERTDIEVEGRLQAAAISGPATG